MLWYFAAPRSHVQVDHQVPDTAKHSDDPKLNSLSDTRIVGVATVFQIDRKMYCRQLAFLCQVQLLYKGWQRESVTEDKRVGGLQDMMGFFVHLAADAQ